MPNQPNSSAPAGSSGGAPRPPESAAPVRGTGAPDAAGAPTSAPRRKRTGASGGTSRPQTGRPVYSTPPRTAGQPRRTMHQKRDVPIPWGLVVFAFVVSWPVGVGLLILNLIISQRDRVADDAVRRRVQAAWHPETVQTDPAAQTGPAASARDSAGQAGTRSDRFLTNALMVLGLVLGLPGGLATLGTVVTNLWILTDYGDLAWFLENIWPPAMLFFGGVGLIIASHKMRTSWLTRRKIANIVGQADHMYIADIAATLGCPVDRCVDCLEHCIQKGVFGAEAYLDMRSMALVVRGPAPEPQPASDAAPAQPQPDQPPREESRYDKILAQLRRVNDAIPDEVMSAKIDRLETLSRKIFAQLEDDPDKLPQLRKFMDYYLPTSLKLLDTYAELEAQGIEGANISESKHRIEQLMDTLVTAFENQLDKLFQDDALDVSTDIDVMEKMLYADGLAGNSDPFGLQGKH